MACPKCNAEVSATELSTPTRGEAARAVLTDFRTWAFSFGVMLVAGLVSGALGFGRAGGTGGGAAIGIFVAMRMAKLRKCPRCNAVIDGPAAS